MNNLQEKIKSFVIDKIAHELVESITVLDPRVIITTFETQDMFDDIIAQTELKFIIATKYRGTFRQVFT